MHLKNLSLFNFRNHEERQCVFGPGLNCITGANGEGKSNLLDAVYFLAFTKSWLSSSEAQCLRHGESIATAKGLFQNGEDHLEVKFSLQSGKKKSFFCNDLLYERITEHIGRIPVILAEPYDTDYVRMGSEMRRRLFDGFISQIEAEYLDNILRYNRLLKQRNAMLKQMALTGRSDLSLFDAIDHSLLPLSRKLYERRLAFIEDHAAVFEEMYAYLSDGKEPVRIRLESDLDDRGFMDKFHLGRDSDIQAQRTQLGIHRDDFVFEIGDGYRLLKMEGSQGQQKSFVLALKLSQVAVIKGKLGKSPILLLDDIFDKLDTGRIQRLLSYIDSEGLQALITDARRERTAELFEVGGYRSAQILEL